MLSRSKEINVNLDNPQNEILSYYVDISMIVGDYLDFITYASQHFFGISPDYGKNPEPIHKK